ncbi:MAG: helix-turn-helix domain-containing protein [Chloroflexia bacterium]|nr:helix-turn-helix domain-containing protein [Chloroflexia bacterium]
MLPAPNTESPSLDIARLVLTPAEVAEALGLNLTELYEKLRRDDVPFPVRRVGRRWMIPRGPFMRWLDGAAGQPDAA